MQERAEKTWSWFRGQPLWAQAAAWLLAFWILAPLLIWRSGLKAPWKALLTIPFVLLVIGVAASEDDRRLTAGSAPTPAPRSSAGAPNAPAETDESFSSSSKKTSSPKPRKSPSQTQEPARRVELATVTRVIDGDTIEVDVKGKLLGVRLIGIDTPETVHPSKPVECFGREASDFTKRSLDGQPVELEFDVERTDRYQRTLAYVWAGDKLFNRTLVAAGYAQVSTYPPNVKYQERFLKAQRKARGDNRGLWGGCPAGAGSQVDQSKAASSGGKCDANYKGACIPPYPPDINCTDIPDRGFQSIGSDPHGFDGDGDGIACES